MGKAKPTEAATLFAEDEPQAAKPARMVATRKPARRQEVAVAEPPKAQNLLTGIMTAITNPAISPEKMHGLLDVRGRVMQEQAAVEFMRAYVKLQAELPTITKDGKIDQGTTRSGAQGMVKRYATYENINRVIKPLLIKHNFALLLMPDIPAEGGGVIIRGTLSYVCTTEYGEIVFSEKASLWVPPEVSGGKNAAQGAGSSLSYAKRYGMVAMLDLISEDPRDVDRDANPQKRDKVREVASLTGDQIKKLKAAIKDCGVSDEAFCNRFQIEKVEHLPPDKFDGAIEACATFKRNRQDS